MSAGLILSILFTGIYTPVTVLAGEEEPVRQEGQATPETKPLPDEGQAAPETEPVPDEEQAIPETEPVPEEGQAAPETEPVPDEEQAAPEKTLAPDPQPPAGEGGELAFCREIFDAMALEDRDFYWVIFAPALNARLSEEEFRQLEDYVKKSVSVWEPERYRREVGGAYGPATAKPDAVTENDGLTRFAVRAGSGTYRATSGLYTLGNTVNLPVLNRNGMDVWKLLLDGNDVFCLDVHLRATSGKTYTRTGTTDDGVVRQAIAFYMANPTRENYEFAQMYIWCGGSGASYVTTIFDYALSKHDMAAYTPEKLSSMDDLEKNGALLAMDRPYALRLGSSYRAITSASAAGLDTVYVFRGPSGHQRFATLYEGVYTEEPGPGPDPEPEPVEPQYDEVSATENRQASRSHQVKIDRKYAQVTGENLKGVVFEVYEDGDKKGSIITDREGKGSLSWEVSGTGSATVTKRYCSNYDDLDEETKASVDTYRSRDEAYKAAQQEASSQAQAQADAAAGAERSVTVKESTAPPGFQLTGESEQSGTLSGEDSLTVSVKNSPWKARVTLDKVDGQTGSRLREDAAFALWEWDGSDYVLSRDYSVIRLTDGTYTVASSLPGAKQGYVYYTQKNEGRFYIQETAAPAGYIRDTKPSYFRITAEDQVFSIGNASPQEYAAGDNDLFANQPAHVRIRIPKTDRYTENPISEDARFGVYAATGSLTGTVLFEKQADGSYLSGEIYYADTLDHANYGRFYLVELEAPEGYYGDWDNDEGEKTAGSAENKVRYAFTVEGDLSNHGRILTVTNDGAGETFWNEHIFGQVVLHKYDSEAQADHEEGGRVTQGDKVTLDGAVYGLYAASPVYHPDGVTGLLYERGALAASATVGRTPVSDGQGYLLDEEGERCVESGREPAWETTPGTTAFKQVEAGSYYVEEITPADGYLPDTTQYRGQEKTRYYVTFRYGKENEAVMLRQEQAKGDTNSLTIDDANGSHDIFSGDFVWKQAAQFVKLENKNTDTEQKPLRAGFSIYRLGSLAVVAKGEIAPEGTVWTAADMEKFSSYDFTQEKTALVYKRQSEPWSDGDERWLAATGERPDEYRVTEMWSDENGYFCTPQLPTGQYILVETTVPEGKRRAAPVLVTVSRDSATAQPLRYIGNETTETYIRIRKTDCDRVEEGWDTVLKPGASYRIRLFGSREDFDSRIWQVDEDGFIWYYNSSLRAEQGTKENPFAISCVYRDGKIADAYVELDQLLPVGRYELTEIKAPEGFVLNGREQILNDTSSGGINSYEITDAPSEKLIFEISNDTVYPDGQAGEANRDEYGRLIITIEQENKEQKGIVEIRKEGEQLADTTASGKSLKDRLGEGSFRPIMRTEEYTVADQVFIYKLAPVKDAVFEVYAAEDIYTCQIEPGQEERYAGGTDHYLVLKKDQLAGRITTDETGYGYLSGLSIGRYYIREVEAGEGFVLNPYEEEFAITAMEPSQSFQVHESFYENERKRLELSSVKRDADSGLPVAGAVFGLYNRDPVVSCIRYDPVSDSWLPDPAGRQLLGADTLIATAVTGEDGVARFDVDLPLGRYDIAELEAPEGYTLQRNERINTDPANKDAVIREAAKAGRTTEGEDAVFVNQKTKHIFTKTDFSSGVLLDGALLEVREICVDENGVPLRNPAGEYETVLVESWISDKEEVHYFYEQEAEAERPFYVELSSPEELPEGKTLIVRQGHLIEGLKEGRQYIFRETAAPEGYVGYRWSAQEVREACREENLATEEIRFTVENSNIIAGHEMKDQRVCGNLIITKEGEVLTGTTVRVRDAVRGFFETVFDYVMGRVAKARFEIRVREDIYSPDQTGQIAVYADGGEPVELYKDRLVAVIETGADGYARLEGLPLGSYYVTETGAGDGEFVRNQRIAEIVLAYQGQQVPVVVHEGERYVNERQRVSLVVTKKARETGAGEPSFGDGKEEPARERVIPGAVFGLYNKEAIYGFIVDPLTGILSENPDALVAADTLLERIPSKMDGTARFAGDLPCGIYYLRELEAPDGYLLSEEEIMLDASYRGPDSPAVLEFAFDFYDEPFSVHVEKRDSADHAGLSGARLQVTDEAGNVVEEWVSDGSAHEIRFLRLDTVYTLSELSPPAGYVTAPDLRFRLAQKTDEAGGLLPDITMLTERTQTEKTQKGSGTVTEWVPSETPGAIMYDGRTKLVITKTDIATGEPVEGAVLTIRNEEGTVMESWITGREPHYIEKLPVGQYILIEERAPEGSVYSVAESVPFTVEDTEELQEVEMKNDRIRLSVKKVAAGTGALLAGAVLELAYLPEDGGPVVVEQFTTGKEEKIWEGLLPGWYLLTELEAPAGYQTAQPLRFVVTDDWQTQEIIMEDTPVPDLPSRIWEPEEDGYGDGDIDTGDAGMVYPAMGMACLGAVFLGMAGRKKDKSLRRDGAKEKEAGDE
ncbi:MAG: hypothetical protein HFI38_13000 [Lachnospiraceae bacterium]|nr:hypothetical protein [Lachnospiraceae bacterium]